MTHVPPESDAWNKAGADPRPVASGEQIRTPSQPKADDTGVPQQDWGRFRGVPAAGEVGRHRALQTAPNRQQRLVNSNALQASQPRRPLSRGTGAGRGAAVLGAAVRADRLRARRARTERSSVRLRHSLSGETFQRTPSDPP
jgi:hypothetical protein